MKNLRIIALAGLIWPSMALAGQVVVDKSFGHAGALTGPIFSVPASVGKQVGPNLFHSFNQFNLSNGDTVAFSGPSSIQNVIARVTGGQPSSIDGKIQSIPGSSFFFINPSGVIFGPHAVIDVDGTFAVSTADYLKFKDGTRLLASQTSNPVLTTAAPAAFGFLNPNPTPITITGDPTVPTTLAKSSQNQSASPTAICVAGGKIMIVGQNLQATSIVLDSFTSIGEAAISGSVPSARGELGIVSVGGGSQVIGVQGPLTINAGTLMDSGGSTIATVSESSSFGGNLTIRALDQVNVAHANVASYSADVGPSGNIRVISPRVLLDGPTDMNVVSGIFTEADSDGTAGNVYILDTRQLSVAGGARVSAATFAGGRGGHVFVKADSVTLDGANEGVGGFTGISANTQNGQDLADPAPGNFSGPAGSVQLHAGALQILSGAGVVSNSLLPGAGKGGVVNVNAKQILINGEGVDVATSIDALSGNLEDLDGSGALAPVAGGPAGVVKVSASKLQIVNGGSIRTNTAGPSNAGQVRVSAGSIFVDRAGSALNTGIGAQVEMDVSGNGGRIDVSAHRVTVVRGGRISVTSLGSGSAGILFLNANTLTLASGGMVQSNAEGSGDGGDLTVRARRAVRLLSDGEITASSTQAVAGDLRVSSGESIFMDQGSITTDAAGNGGSIRISAPDKIYLLNGSQITTNSTATGNGGNINIDPIEVVLESGSGIHANADGPKSRGGRIAIQADQVSGAVLAGPMAQRNITAIGGAPGLSGSVSLGTFQTDIAGSLVQLPTQLVAPALLIPHCGVQFGEDQSSFVITDRGGTPAEPGGWLPEISLDLYPKAQNAPSNH